MSRPWLTLCALLVLCALPADGPAQVGPSAPAARTRGGAHVPGEILIKFEPSAGAAHRSSALSQLGATRLRAFRSGAEHWRLGAGVGVEQALDRMRRASHVAYAEPNYVGTFDQSPNDTRFAEQWALLNTAQSTSCASSGKPDADIDADLAWNTTTGGDVVVAVPDTGVASNHPDLAANMIAGYDFADNDANPSPDPSFPMCLLRGHGTHVAGIIGAVGNNAKGVAGVNWTVKIMPLKISPNGDCGDITVAVAIEAIDHATAQGADVINASWGFGDSFSQALMDSIEQAGVAGILFVAAAGNASGDNDVADRYPANYPLGNIVAVAATDSRDLKAGFSNYGETMVDLGAPGAGVLSTLPADVADPNQECEDLCLPPQPRYDCASGTSMAAPHVAGVAALMRAVDPSVTPEEMRCLLVSSTDPVPSLVFRTVSGGRLNARGALDALLAGQPCIVPTSFRFKKTLVGSNRVNLVSLPYVNVFQGPGGPEALCQAFGLGSTATITQYDALGLTYTHACGTTPTFQLLDRKGVMITEEDEVTRTGFIEGSDDPNGLVRIEDLGYGTIGRNLFPVRYNGTAVTPQDLCTQCGLSSQAQITRFDAQTGYVLSHVCGQLPLWNLVLGEAVLIAEPQGPKDCAQPAF